MKGAAGNSNTKNSQVFNNGENDSLLPIKDWILPLQGMDDSEQIIEHFRTYKPLQPTFDLNALIKSENLRIRKRKASIYFGELNSEAQRDGKGILCYFDGRTYEGDWKENKKIGKGIEVQSNGSKYIGTFANGKRGGKGQFKWANGEVYDGEWKHGMKHGSGLWKSPKGDSYIGEWRDGKADGFGVHTWINGDRYEGEFQQFLKHGLGTERFGNGDVYIGNYEFGKPEGYGEYFWGTGNYYKGYFVNGLRHGRGIWKSVKEGGDTYEGEYRNDKKSGYGEYRWASGNIYRGNFENDLRHGYGEMYLKDNTLHKGYWMNGLQAGQSYLGPADVDDQIAEYQRVQNPQNLPTVQISGPLENSPGVDTDRQQPSTPSKNTNSTTRRSLNSIGVRQSHHLPKINSNGAGNQRYNQDGQDGNGADQSGYAPAPFSMSPKMKSSNFILPKLECKSCSSKKSTEFTSPRRNGSMQPNRFQDSRVSQSARKHQDLSTDNSSRYRSSPQRDSSSNKNTPRVWRPSGVAQQFNLVGFDLNAKNIVTGKQKQ